MTMARAQVSSPASGLADAIRRSALWLALLAALGVLIVHFAIQAHSAAALIRYPYGLDYGEGIVWQQMRNIMAGRGYAPLGVYPAIVYHYPPVFHIIVGITARLFGIDELATGRAISWLSTLGCAVLIGMLTVVIGRANESRFA
uniref:hypothetical protein n=1 Tax=uncultured Caballeronia sp. TaxID=1827198 RepID=UPI0035CA65A5